MGAASPVWMRWPSFAVFPRSSLGLVKMSDYVRRAHSVPCVSDPAPFHGSLQGPTASGTTLPIYNVTHLAGVLVE